MSQEEETDDGMTYEEFNVLMKTESFAVFEDEDSFEKLRSAIHDMDEWENWFQETAKAVCGCHPEEPEKSAEMFETIYEGYLGLYIKFFNEANAEESFEQFKNLMVEADTQLLHQVHQYQIELIFEEKDPEEVFDSPTALAKHELSNQ